MRKLHKYIFLILILFLSIRANAQTTIKHEGGFVRYLDKVYERLEEIEPYPATLTLSLDPKTNTYFITITPEKGELQTFEFTKPTQKEKCASLVANGKKAASSVRFRVSGLDCKLKHPKITIRDNNKEYFFLLTDEGNDNAVSELRKAWVKK